MKNSKRHCRYDPVFVGPGFINDDYEYSRDQKNQQQAPAFPHMNQHFTQVILNINSADDKGNYKQTKRCDNPNRSRDGRKGKPDMRNQVSPVQLMGEIQNQYKE